MVCEREIAGFGASGRNGGWCSALFPASLAKLDRMAGRDAAIAMYRAMQQTVDEVGRVAAAEGIDCHWAKGGTVQLARSAAQLERARAEIAEAREFGFGEDGPAAADRPREAQRARRRDRRARRRRTRRTARRSTRPGWPAGWPRPCAGAGWRVYEKTPVTEHRAGRAGHRRRAPSGPGT